MMEVPVDPFAPLSGPSLLQEEGADAPLPDDDRMFEIEDEQMSKEHAAQLLLHNADVVATNDNHILTAFLSLDATWARDEEERESVISALNSTGTTVKDLLREFQSSDNYELQISRMTLALGSSVNYNTVARLRACLIEYLAAREALYAPPSALAVAAAGKGRARRAPFARLHPQLHALIVAHVELPYGEMSPDHIHRLERLCRIYDAKIRKKIAPSQAELDFIEELVNSTSATTHADLSER